MKKLNYIYIILLMIVSVTHGGEKIKIILQQPPPNKLNVKYLWKIDITNTTRENINIYLIGTATESKKGLIVSGKSKVFSVSPGTKTYTYEDFKSGEVNWKDKAIQEVLFRTNNVPEGDYTICVTAFYENNEEADQEQCIEQPVKPEGSITLITPGNGDEVDPKIPVLFSWTPLQGAKEYTLRIVEIKGDESPETAFKTRKPRLEKTGIRNTSIEISPIAIDDDEIKIMDKKRKWGWQIICGEVVSEAQAFIKSSPTITQNEKTDLTPNKWPRYFTAGFIENKGQFNRTAGGETVEPEYAPLLKAELRGCDFFLTKRGFSYFFFEAEEISEDETNELDSSGIKKDKDAEINYKYNRVDFNFDNITILKENITFEEPDNQGVMNYYFENHPEGILNVETFQKVTIKNVYDKIDLTLYGNDTLGIKYEFIVNPGGDPSKIKFGINGAKDVKLTENKTKLLIDHDFSKFEDGPLKVFYKENLIRIPFEYSENNDKYSLNSFEYDRTKTIVIDPLVNLYWSTLYGGNRFDGFQGVETDIDGNIFVCGYSGSSNYPTFNPGNGAYYRGVLSNSIGILDGIIIKFNSFGKRKWCTYFGGASTEKANDICIFQDMVLLTGFTASINFPVMNNGGFFKGIPSNTSPQPNGFIVKFNTAGELKWATYYGGNSVTYCNSITSNNAGIFFIGGYTNSSNNFPIMTDGTYSFQQSYNGSTDAFILAFDVATNNLKWSTYYGGRFGDECNSVVTDNAGNLFISGDTRSDNLSVIQNGSSYNMQHSGMTDIFAAGFDNGGNLFWSTYYGGAMDDFNYSLCSDNNNNIILTGTTSSPGFPVSSCTEGQNPLGNNDIYLVKFSNQGDLRWSRLFGGSNFDYAKDIISHNNNYWITGQTKSDNFQSHNPYDGSMFFNYLSGATDAYLTRFNENGILNYSTYFGSNNSVNNSDWGYAMCLTGLNELIITGELSGYFNHLLRDPGNQAYIQPVNAGYDDSFIMKLNVTDNPPPPPPPPPLAHCTECPSGLQPGPNIVINSDFSLNTYNPNWARNTDYNAGFFYSTGSFEDPPPGLTTLNGNKFAIRPGVLNVLPAGPSWNTSATGRGGTGDNFFIYQYTSPETGTAQPKIIWQQQNIPVTTNTNYVLCFYTRKLNTNPSIQNPKIKVRLFQTGGTWLTNIIPEWTEVIWDNWQLLTASWAGPPSGVNNVNLEIWGSPVDGNTSPCPVAIGLDDISFNECGNNIVTNCNPDLLIGTDITVYPDVSVKLNSFLCKRSNGNNGAIGVLDLPMGPEKSPAVINPDPSTVPQNTFSSLDPNKHYLVYSFENGRLMTDGNQWGRLFDPQFFINRNQGPTKYGSYSVECINQINPVLTLSNGSYPILNAPVDNSGNAVFNYAWNRYYCTFTASDKLICKNLFSPLRQWSFNDNGTATTIGSLSLGNINQPNVMRFHIYELCNITDFTDYSFNWELLESSISIPLQNVKEQDFPSGIPPGNYYFQLKVTLPDGTILTDYVSVKVESNYFNQCN